EAVDGGQHAVDDQRVVALGRREEQAVLAVVGVIDVPAGLRQALADEGGDVRVVLDDQNAHFPAGPFAARRRAAPDRSGAFRLAYDLACSALASSRLIS